MTAMTDYLPSDPSEVELFQRREEEMLQYVQQIPAPMLHKFVADGIHEANRQGR